MKKRLFDLKLGKGHELLLALQNAGLTAMQAELVIDSPVLARNWVDTLKTVQPYDRFIGFAHLLRQLDNQVVELRRLNKKMPKPLRAPDIWFDCLERDDDHIQSVESLKFYYVVKDTLEETLAYNWELMNLSQSSVCHSGFLTDQANLRLFDQNSCQYNPGVQLVEINLVDNWSQDESQSVEMISNNAFRMNEEISSGVKFAGVEVIGAYALHPKLLHLQDGEKLPFCNLAGLQQGRSYNQTPRLFWNSARGQACLSSCRSDSPYRHYASPTIKLQC